MTTRDLLLKFLRSLTEEDCRDLLGASFGSRAATLHRRIVNAYLANCAVEAKHAQAKERKRR